MCGWGAQGMEVADEKGKTKGHILVVSGVNWAPNSLWAVVGLRVQKGRSHRGRGPGWVWQGCDPGNSGRLGPHTFPAGLQLGFNGPMWNALGHLSRKSMFKGAGSFWLSRKTFLYGQFPPEPSNSGTSLAVVTFKASHVSGSLCVFTIFLEQRRIDSLTCFSIWSNVKNRKDFWLRVNVYGLCEYP